MLQENTQRSLSLMLQTAAQNSLLKMQLRNLSLKTATNHAITSSVF